MKLFTGLFRAARKRLATHDTDMGSFRDAINELVAGKDGMSDEDVAAKVEALKEITNDLPESEDKSKLLRFIEDFKEVKSQDEATAKSAGEAVADLFEKLDTEAMKDAPEFDSPEAEPAAEPVETEVAEEVVEETKEPAPEDGAEEVEAAKKEVCEDDDNSEYTLEEIYQFIKKRMAEDESCDVDQEEIQEDSAEEIEGEEVTEEDEDMTTDHAPHIPVTLKGNANNSGIAEMFANIKNGGIR